MNKYELYVVDTETGGLDPIRNGVIEVSFYRLSDDVQKTWCIKPSTSDVVEPAALRINGHKIEDLNHQTKHGRDTYLEPTNAIVQIENWIAEDNCSTENRVMVGQNTQFDKLMLEQLWIKCNAKDTFPFGRRTMDTMGIQFFLDWCQDNMDEGYSLSNLVKKYGVKNDKSHTAASDTKATKEVFLKQVSFFKRALAKQE